MHGKTVDEEAALFLGLLIRAQEGEVTLQQDDPLQFTDIIVRRVVKGG